MNLLNQVKHWPHGREVISDWLGSGGHVVDRELAQQRADICLTCPMNGETNTVTGAFAGGIKRLLEMKNKLGLRVHGEKALGLCDVCGCANRLRIWQPMPLVREAATTEELRDYPPHCWIKTEL